MADKRNLDRARKLKKCLDCNGTGLVSKKAPESRFFDGLKGEQVCVVLKRGESSLTATLLWVDRYSLGFQLDDGRERMIHKHAIQSLGKA